MSTFTLKLTALVLMLLDHIGYYLVPPLSSPRLYLLLRHPPERRPGIPGRHEADT